MPNSYSMSARRRHKSSTSKTLIHPLSPRARRQRLKEKSAVKKKSAVKTKTRSRIVMAKTVADQFAETLAAAGVKRIYGIVGDSLNGLTDSISRQDKIERVHVRHEEGAAFPAGAGAHPTGELAASAGVCGPG